MKENNIQEWLCNNSNFFIDFTSPQKNNSICVATFSLSVSVGFNYIKSSHNNNYANFSHKEKWY